MLKFLPLQLMGWLLACRMLASAGIIAVPPPKLYTDRLPPRIAHEVQSGVAKAVRQAGHMVAEDLDDESYLVVLKSLESDSQRAYLRAKGIDGVLCTELQRGLGGFVLRVEPVGCDSSLGFPEQPFAISIGQYQNLPRCVDELAARLNAGGGELAGGALTAVLAPQVMEPLAPLYLGNYLSSRLENGLLARGYHLCTEESLGKALRGNRLGGYFELTKERREHLSSELQVQSFIQIVVNEYQIHKQGDGALQALIGGTVREIAAFNGEVLKSFSFQLELGSSDGRLAAYPVQTLSDTNAFGQAALDLLVKEQLLSHWPNIGH